MSYVDGFILAVPTARKAEYIAHAALAAPSFRRHGALRVVETWGDDVPEGKVTDFQRSVQAKPDETVCFSWIEWPDKATRDAAMPKVFEEMETLMKDHPMPFDGQRMVYGGFQSVLDD
ncbi:DUF1428 domain-containing protein [Cereibacter sp. SYSU M97828]|nr:DUF1428 domain-containing protein [Cereibacter flavus]